MARAGSAAWLLRHELRMYLLHLLGTRKDGASTGIGKKAVAVWLALACLMHGFAYMVLAKVGLPAGPPPLALLHAVGILMAGVVTMMMSSGLSASVSALFERGDLDLLLSSPIASSSVFGVRLAAIAAGSCVLYLFFLAPFAHAGIALGQYRWLGLYPAIVGLTLVASSASMLLTLALVRWLGVRRTRVAGQLLGALSGAALFLLAQASNSPLGPALRALLARLAALTGNGAGSGSGPGPGSALWLPARAALGEPWPALFMLGTGAAVFLLTARLAHGFFVRSVQQAAGAARVARAPAAGMRLRFGRGLARSVIVKEWRLIWRDPQLIAQVGLQLMYLLPLLAPLLFGRAVALPTLTAALVFLCGSLSASLGWIVIAAEEAPDLLRAAPCKQGTIRRAKLAAVAIPPLALALVPLCWLGLRQPAAAATMLLACALCACNAALVVAWCSRPALRGEFRRRGKSNLVCTVFELLTCAGWAGLGFVLMTGLEQGSTPALALGAAMLALLLLAFAATARFFRVKPV
jgi:ABC-2 type transport system permease protein